MARYRAALRSKAFTKLSWSKTKGFVSYSKVVYERCRMNFCFGWSDADVRGLIAAGDAHPYVLPKPDGVALALKKGVLFSNNPDFHMMHCVEDREFNFLHRLVSIVHAGNRHL